MFIFLFLSIFIDIFISDNKTESLTNLENAFQNIQNAADEGAFTVEVLDDEYELDGNLTDISGEVVCPSGHTRVNFYCGEF